MSEDILPLDFVCRYIIAVINDQGEPPDVVAIDRPLYRCVQRDIVYNHYRQNHSESELFGISIINIQLITRTAKKSLAQNIDDNTEIGDSTLMVNCEMVNKEDLDPECYVERGQVLNIMRNN